MLEGLGDISIRTATSLIPGFPLGGLWAMARHRLPCLPMESSFRRCFSAGTSVQNA